jgi:hypothetical protein
MPLIIFKAQPGGSVGESFDDYPEGAVYAVQPNAWMDADVWNDVFINTLWVIAVVHGGLISIMNSIPYSASYTGHQNAISLHPIEAG